ncbi:MAG: hypothetical protein HC945_03155 [Nitrosarchaeum sp.]|nr:hypothetical protein [Nitrosarchaeum sp.]
MDEGEVIEAEVVADPHHTSTVRRGDEVLAEIPAVTEGESREVIIIQPKSHKKIEENRMLVRIRRNNQTPIKGTCRLMWLFADERDGPEVDHPTRDAWEQSRMLASPTLLGDSLEADFMCPVHKEWVGKKLVLVAWDEEYYIGRSAEFNVDNDGPVEVKIELEYTHLRVDLHIFAVSASDTELVGSPEKYVLEKPVRFRITQTLPGDDTCPRWEWEFPARRGELVISGFPMIANNAELEVIAVVDGYFGTKIVKSLLEDPIIVQLKKSELPGRRIEDTKEVPKEEKELLEEVQELASDFATVEELKKLWEHTLDRSDAEPAGNERYTIQTDSILWLTEDEMKQLIRHSDALLRAAELNPPNDVDLRQLSEEHARRRAALVKALRIRKGAKQTLDEDERSFEKLMMHVEHLIAVFGSQEETR